MAKSHPEKRRGLSQWAVAPKNLHREVAQSLGSQSDRGSTGADKYSENSVTGCGPEGSAERMRTWRQGSGQPGVSTNLPEQRGIKTERTLTAGGPGR